MFTRKWQLMFLYIGLIDLGATHLTVIVGTGGGAFINKNCLQGRAFDHFFKCPGFARGFAWGMLAAGIDSHITAENITLTRSTSEFITECFFYCEIVYF